MFLFYHVAIIKTNAGCILFEIFMFYFSHLLVKKNQWICSVLWTQTNNKTHDFFQLPKLEVQPVHTSKNISLAYPQQCLQLQLLLIYYFSFIAFVWIVWNSETPSPLKSTLNNTEPAAERLTRNLYWRERLAFFLFYNSILIKLLTLRSSWQI